MSIKKEYSEPKLTRQGSVERLTNGSSCVDTSLDMSFASGTPRGDLRCFS